MPIKAKHDCTVRDGAGYVTYIKYYDGDNLVATGSYKYDPNNDEEFKKKVKAKVTELENNLEAAKSQVAKALEDL